MTIDEVRKLYRRILDRLYQDRLYDAFLDISYLMQQNGFGEVFDKLHEQELNYSYLLQYRLDGYQDKDRDKVLSDMKRTLFQLADQAWSDWQSAFSSQWYYSQKRYRNINGQNKRDFAALSQLLSRCREDEHMLTEAASQDGVAQRLAEVRGQKEQLTGDFFLQLLFDEPWKEGDYARMPAHCQALDENGQALCVSALLLAVQQMFDEYKLLFLADLCDSSSPLVAMRALTALMLLMDQYQKRISGIPALTSRLSLLFDRPEIRAAASGIFAQLIRAKEAEQVSRRMKEEFLPEMNKLGSSIRQRLEDNKDQSGGSEKRPGGALRGRRHVGEDDGVFQDADRRGGCLSEHFFFAEVLSLLQGDLQLVSAFRSQSHGYRVCISRPPGVQGPGCAQGDDAIRLALCL